MYCVYYGGFYTVPRAVNGRRKFYFLYAKHRNQKNRLQCFSLLIMLFFSPAFFHKQIDAQL